MSGRAVTTARYGLVSGACLVTHNVVMIAADALGVPMPVAVFLSYCIVVILGFLLHARFTFAVAAGVGSFLRYAAAMAANLPLTLVLLWLFSELLAIPMAVAAPIATLILVGVNFVASRWAIASPRPKGAQA